MSTAPPGSVSYRHLLYEAKWWASGEFTKGLAEPLEPALTLLSAQRSETRILGTRPPDTTPRKIIGCDSQANSQESLNASGGSCVRRLGSHQRFRYLLHVLQGRTNIRIIAYLGEIMDSDPHEL